MTVNQITRQLFVKGKRIREQTVKGCLRQELQVHVKQVRGRWTARVEESDRVESETEETKHGEEQEDRKATSEKKQLEAPGEQPEADQPFPVFVPSGAVGHVAADLERAKYLALVLELAPHPLKVSDLVQVLGKMGLAVPAEDVERLLAGPLRLYVRREGTGWMLRQEAAAPAPHARAGANGVPPGEDFTEKQAPADHALLAHIKADGMAYEFVEADLDSPAFFSADMQGASTMRINLNARHPAYDLLQEALKVGAPEAADIGALRRLLRNTQRGLQPLLVGWARYEEDLEGPRRRRAQETRSDWGRSARRIVRRHEGRASE